MKQLVLLLLLISCCAFQASAAAGVKSSCMNALKAIAGKQSVTRESLDVREDFLLKNARQGFDRVNFEAFSDLDYVKIMFPDRMNDQGMIRGVKLENVAQVNTLETDLGEVFEIIFEQPNTFSYFKLDSSGVVNIDAPKKFKYSRTYYSSNTVNLRTPKSYILESKDGYKYTYNIVERRHSTFIESNDSVIELPDYDGDVIDIEIVKVKNTGEVLKVYFDEDASKAFRLYQYDHSLKQIVEINF